MPKVNFNRTAAIVFDNHSLFADSFSSMIEQFKIFNRTYTFYEIDELLQFFKTQAPEEAILFADYYLQDANFIAYINEVRRLSRKLRIVIVSSLSHPVIINSLLSYDIDGIISKNAKSREIIDCIQSFPLEGQYLSPEIREILEQSENTTEIPFSPRELEILSYFAKGLTVDATAVALNLSRHTISAHRRKMMLKSNSNNIIELLSYARDIELI